jgi:hypothetical protein
MPSPQGLYQIGPEPLGNPVTLTNPLPVEQIGTVNVNVVGGIGAGGTAAPDESSFTAGLTPGTPMMVEFGGELLIAAGDASRRLQVAGSLASTPPVSSTASAPAQQTVGVLAGSILAANASRKGCAVQNTGTSRIYLGLGANPTTSNYHIALPACGNGNDGSSAVWDGTISGALWQGAVYAISSAAGGTVVVTELT